MDKTNWANILKETLGEDLSGSLTKEEYEQACDNLKNSLEKAEVLLKIVKTELTTDIQNALYDKSQILDATAKTLYVETFGPDYDEGMFPPDNKGLWTRFLNKVDRDGIYYLTKKCAYKGDEVKITNDDDKLIYEFKYPIQVKTGFQIKGGEKIDVISEITYLKVECDYEYYYRGHGELREIQIEGKIIDMK